ncbi:MAG: glucose-6-phosphate dehydrogenase [Candidatus Magasanikbacteria bacterium]
MDQPNLEKSNIPTAFIIFGATGDLAQKKIWPSLFALYRRGMLPEKIRFIGNSRSKKSNKEFRKFLKELLEDEDPKNKYLDNFLKNVFFQSGDLKEKEVYKEIKAFLNNFEEEIGMCYNSLFYLSIPPVIYEQVFNNLKESGLSEPCSKETGWARILVEKPFGEDLKMAEKIDGLLSNLFKEKQVFRIDHYLSKEVMQNILMFRFSNALFSPVWNGENIEKIEIIMKEDFGVRGRGSFYDSTGAIRDVGQNHILQMLAAATMEYPGSLKPEDLREARAQLFKDINPIPEKEIQERVVLGQYEGYSDLPNVEEDSNTETYFNIKAFIDNSRWRNTPVYLKSGKSLDETCSEINLYLKETPCLCPPEMHEPHQNVITFRIKPEEELEVIFWAKKPGFELELERTSLSFSYQESREDHQLIPAYQKALFYATKGDQTLFVSSEEVIEMWKFVNSILKNKKKLKLQTYERGSKGPKNNNF